MAINVTTKRGHATPKIGNKRNYKIIIYFNSHRSRNLSNCNITYHDHHSD